MSPAAPANPVFCALDTVDLRQALDWARAVKPYVGGLKIGMEFFNANGPEGVKAVVALGLPVFADLKLHDIPNTVAGGVRGIAPLGVAMLNIHTSGGFAMMRAAAEEARKAGAKRMKILGVTILTSLDQQDLRAVGMTGTPEDQVLRLAQLAKDAGLDGVVCGSHEIAPLRATLGREFMLVVPGIRPAGAALVDQKRVMTPFEARALGADILVVGRPITAASDPAAAARAIHDELFPRAA
jgi:orotidine-5'-phosphate decarboxylase